MQREHELHRLQQAAEIERQIELEQLRQSAREAGTQPQRQQSQPQRYEHGHLQERRLYHQHHQHRGDVAGAPRPAAQQLHHLTDTLQRFSFSDNVARAPEQPPRREVAAQAVPAPFGAAHLCLKKCAYEASITQTSQTVCAFRTKAAWVGRNVLSHATHLPWRHASGSMGVALGMLLLAAYAPPCCLLTDLFLRLLCATHLSALGGGSMGNCAV